MLRAPLAPPMQALLDARLAPARAALGDGDAARIWNEGRSTTLQSLLAEAGQAGPVDDAGELGSDEAVRLLSRRERDVTALVAHGLRNYEIGERLGITRHTVEVHVSKTLNKLGMASRAQLAVWAVANGLLQPSS